MSRVTDQDELWVTAVHESAHAVAAIKSRISVVYIKVGMGRGSKTGPIGGGYVRPCFVGGEEGIDDSRRRVSADELESLLVYTLAASPADTRAWMDRGFSRRMAEKFSYQTGASDRETAREYSRNAKITMRAAQKQADRIVEKHWSAIELLAGTVLDRGGYMPGLDVVRLVKNA